MPMVNTAACPPNPHSDSELAALAAELLSVSAEAKARHKLPRAGQKVCRDLVSSVKCMGGD